MRLRAYVAVSAAIGVAAVLVGVLAFRERNQHFAGTNSAGPSARVATLTPEQRLCVRDLWMPKGANAVSLRLGTNGRPPTRVVLTLDTPAGRARSAARVTSRNQADAVFPLPRAARGVPASFCLKTDGVLGTVAGTLAEPFRGTNYAPRAGRLPEPTGATLDGKRLPALVTVRFLEAAPRSTPATLADAARRASLFRPGFVGPWTYLVLALLVPALWIVGLALLWRRRA
jgi:hypothetical protein